MSKENLINKKLVLKGYQSVAGYLYEFKQSSIRIKFQIPINSEANQSEVLTSQVWSNLMPMTEKKYFLKKLAKIQATPEIILLAEGLQRLQLSAGWPVFEPVVLEAIRPISKIEEQKGSASNKGLEVIMLIPTHEPLVLQEHLKSVIEFLNSQFLLADDETKKLGFRLNDDIVPSLARHAPAGTNQRHFLRVAGEMRIPVLPLPGRVHQFGWGCQSRLFNSSISDATPAISTSWAKDKRATNTLFKMAGLPVTMQLPALTLDMALAGAEKLGYPVVLKPADLEQGQGVEADLRNTDELRTAYSRSMAISKNLILEKHIQGEDYRVYVVKGAVLGVAHRIAAGIVGDGVNTVVDLLALENASRRQVLGHDSVYKLIEWDSEATEMLERQGLEMHSVPRLGQKIRLRRSANSSRGGRSVDVTSTMHPDNAALCVKAAGVLRLDIVGLDLLMPDISKSWKEVECGFCEANAQPQMGGAQPWLFEKILRSFVVGQGRIPVVMVLESSDEEQLTDYLASALKQDGKAVEIVKGSGMKLINEGKAALMNPQTEMLLMQTDGLDLQRYGLPVDRVDVLLVAGGAIKLRHLPRILQLLSYQVGVGVILEEGILEDANGLSCLNFMQRAMGEKRVQTKARNQIPQTIKEALFNLPLGG